MKQVNIHGPEDVRIEDVPLPEPGPRDALIRVAACGICGSDLGYVGLGGVAGPTGRPMPLGHELSGVIERLGSEVRDFSEGMRVVVNPIGSNNQIGNGGPEGAFASHLLVRNVTEDRCLFELPDSLSMDRAALAEPLGVGARAVDRAAVQPGERVVVFGAGPIGLASIATLRYRGIEDVIAVDLSDARLSIAQKLGARVGLNPERDPVWERIRELHGTSPVLGAPMAATEVYIEASGASSLVGEVLAQCRSEARLCVVALHRQEVPVNFLLLMMKQMNIAGSLGYPEDWNEMLTMLSEVDLDPMITHRFPLESFPEALATARDARAGAKVLIELA
jgi:threonine dehydrogenase-like Zn-dependent dehydrogenase